ncbi:hypothetical protein [Staphylococcus delphini]|uniref:Uncharacterized protein n=2 Tax=Staphylococcus delphini TaxID=53344 RepID=A0AAQ0D5K4_9STAP|nr:hypothetical protein [Staphylococcus delphini]QUM66159.1 hypothetical protein IPU21_08430 [Staphylococcus delphini]QUM68594.1 hypothetical protein IPU22_08380 [Staphylococcus delphini]
MYDIKEIVEIAKEIGMEVDESPKNNESGFYSISDNNQTEKWDAFSAFGLVSAIKKNDDCHNNYFNKHSYTKETNRFSYNSSISKNNTFPSNPEKIDSLITEAA